MWQELTGLPRLFLGHMMEECSPFVARRMAIFCLEEEKTAKSLNGMARTARQGGRQRYLWQLISFKYSIEFILCWYTWAWLLIVDLDADFSSLKSIPEMPRSRICCCYSINWVLEPPVNKNSIQFETNTLLTLYHLQRELSPSTKSYIEWKWKVER